MIKNCILFSCICHLLIVFFGDILLQKNSNNNNNNHNAKILHILLQKYRKTLNNGRISPIFYNFAEKLNEFKRFSTFIHIKKA